MDMFDRASELEQTERDLSIRAARAKSLPDTTYHSHCAWCGDPSEGGKRFCSYGADSCAADANRRQDMLDRQGVVRL